MQLLKNVLETWKDKLKVPKPGTFSFEEIRDSNIILIKNSNNEIGIIVHKTLAIPEAFKVRHLQFSYHKEIIDKEKKTVYDNCQMIIIEKDMEEEYIINILFSLLDYKSKKHIDSFDIMNILNGVNDNIQIENYSFNEIIGVWGELSFLLHIIQNIQDKDKMFELLKSWESDFSRNKIDFRFNNIKAACEIKTTIKEERIHHISGHKQCIPPENINDLYFVSIRIKDDDTGYSCNDLTNQIKEILFEKNLIDLFDNKLTVRGSKYCLNQSFKFSFLDKKPFKTYNSINIELPVIPKGIFDMEWKQSFDFVDETSYENSIENIINYFKLGL
jgi:hypothetical protein